MPCGPENYNILELKEMTTVVDIFYLMAYDFAGDWDTVTGHQSNLYGGALNVDQAIQDFQKAGVPSKKLVMGLPMYGRGFSNTKQAPGSTYSGVPKGTWDKGSFDYKDLPRPGAKEYFDKNVVASWSFDKEKKEFITYDSPDVINLKSQYIKDNGLGGAMFWELSADKKEPDQSLLNTVYNNLGSQMNSVNNHILYPLSHYDNIPHH
jgi:chitinase